MLWLRLESLYPNLTRIGVQTNMTVEMKLVTAFLATTTDLNNYCNENNKQQENNRQSAQSPVVLKIKKENVGRF